MYKYTNTEKYSIQQAINNKHIQKRQYRYRLILMLVTFLIRHIKIYILFIIHNKYIDNM